jgi:hypothetical protein
MLISMFYFTRFRGIAGSASISKTPNSRRNKWLNCKRSKQFLRRSPQLRLSVLSAQRWSNICCNQRLSPRSQRSPTFLAISTITPGGTTADVEILRHHCRPERTSLITAISETFTFSADASSAVVGNKAFATVTSVSWPANCESGGFAATWSVGVGEKIGLKRCMADAGSFIQSSLGGAHEATLATVAADASNVEGNTADFNGTMNGSNNFKAYFIQNYGCFP